MKIFLKNVNYFFFHSIFYYNNFVYLNSFINIFFFFNLKNVKFLYKNYNANIFINSFNNNKYLLNKHLKLNIFFFKFYNIIKLDYKQSKFIDITIYYNFFKFCNIFLNNFFYQDNNLLVLDNIYKDNYSFLSNIYSKKDIVNYACFFFPNPSFFSRKGWVFYFELFCKSFSVSLFVISNYKLFENYFNEIYSLNIPTVTLNYEDKTNNKYLSDYCFFYNAVNSLYHRFVLLFSINNIFFVTFNMKNFLYKKKYLYLFFKFINIL